MNNLALTEIVICTTCRMAGTPREHTADGLNLLETVQEALLEAEGEAETGVGVRVRGQACLSGCNRACTLAFQAAGKQTYYFGDLSCDAETAAHVLACARLHQCSADGTLERKDRPERLRNGILGRLPALGTARDHL
ncbi:metal-binding protein [Hydrogenophaga crassostreae]|uniref:Metal-binding protein n=2 Tax=Hydrogenophaga crassostreae TaxID=1763535 RepID=A0A167H462_9BURK|nr:metal-binding protein [Hydrogenophaga crassostreae]OAD40245.1 metal-binding protein [Hydrogenophaga crassostreae]